MPRNASSWALCLPLVISACGGAAVNAKRDNAMLDDWERRTADTASGEKGPSASTDLAKPAEPTPAVAMEEVPQRTGSVPRSKVVATLEGGLGKFLSGVQLQASMRAGKFIGFRIQSLPRDAAWAQTVDLAPGDVVVSVNGLPIERPEQALTVWENLKKASALRVEYLRGAAITHLEFDIVDDTQAKN